MKAVNLEKLLPADIPAGERILWHGRPSWLSLARRAYRGDFVAAYFVALGIWNLASAAASGDPGAVAATGLKTSALAVAALALLGFLGYASARSTLYVVTTKRLVLKVGIALPIFINVPFAKIASAGGAGLRRRNRRRSRRTRPERARRLFRALAARATVPLRAPATALSDASRTPRHVGDIVGRALAAAAGETARARGAAAVVEAREVVPVASEHAPA